MKVKELIKKLKSMPQNSEVHVRDHDQSDEEVSGSVGSVSEMETEDGDIYVVLSS